MSGVGTGRAAPARQLLPLVRLRWRMVRTPAARLGLGLTAATLPLLIIGSIAVGLLVPRTIPANDVLVLTPTLLLGFLVLSITAPLAAGGGVELYPAEQLVAYPIRPRTIYVGALLLAPLNLAWLLQVLLALALITYVTSGALTGRLATALTVAIYLAFVTLLGQAIAWAVVGIRRTRRGRTATWIALVAVGASLLLLVRTGRLTEVLDSSPTVWVVVGALAPSAGDWATWGIRSSVLVALTGASAAAGIALCRWAIQRPGDGGVVRQERAVPRRKGASPGTVRLLMHLDRTSIWRAPALRRGALVLGVLPPLVIALTRSDWSTLVLLPGLVSAGAALLFGVNAFSLDASGAIWLTSLPLSERTQFWIRTATVAQSIALPVVLAVGTGLLRVGAPWSWVDLLAVMGAAIASVSRVTAMSLKWSVRRPHRAELRGPRDTPAPPGAMAVYALRLSISTTGIGLLMSVLALIDRPDLILLATTGLVALAARSLHSTAASYARPAVRARVVAVVSGG